MDSQIYLEYLDLQLLVCMDLLKLDRVTCICIPGEPVADPFWRVAREGILEPWFRIWRPSSGDAVVTMTVMAHTIASKIT